MINPIIDPSQLTEEQRVEIRNLYYQSVVDSSSVSMPKRVSGSNKCTLLKRLFGKSMFDNGENNE